MTLCMLNRLSVNLQATLVTMVTVVTMLTVVTDDKDDRSNCWAVHTVSNLFLQTSCCARYTIAYFLFLLALYRHCLAI